jgi:hypothetical protein
MDLCLFIGNNLSDAKVTKILIVFYSRYGRTRNYCRFDDVPHHGMIIVGIPYSVPEHIGSGSLYGPIVGSLSTKKIEEADIKVAQALGKRVAEISRKLSS